MLEHDHVRAAKMSRYRQLKIDVYETTSYLRISTQVKPLNACWCGFTPVNSERTEKMSLQSVPLSYGEILGFTAEQLMVWAFPPAID